MILKNIKKRRFYVLMLKFSWLHMSALQAKLMKDERCCMESRVLWCKGKDTGHSRTRRFKQITGGLAQWSGCYTQILLEGDELMADPWTERRVCVFKIVSVCRYIQLNKLCQMVQIKRKVHMLVSLSSAFSVFLHHSRNLLFTCMLTITDSKTS